MRRLEHLLALIGKEFLQVMRDPSCLLLAFVLPMVLLFIFGYGISLDVEGVRTGVVLEDRSPLAQSFFSTLEASGYLDIHVYPYRAAAEDALTNAHIRAVLVVPNDFSRQIHRGQKASVQLLLDGSETNTAIILEQYVLGISGTWTAHQARDAQKTPQSAQISIQSHLRFNPERNTRNALIPGSIVLIMAMIGTLLTALVVAREWERGTMEAILATPVHKYDLLLGKLLPYYLLGIGSAAVCTLVGVFLFGVPFRGSIGMLFVTTSLFLFVALMQGLFISTLCKNQFLASQVAMLVSFLPNYILSGILFEIQSMPFAIRVLTYFFPARYYAVCLQTIFMAGDVQPLLKWNSAFLLGIGLIVLIATIRVTPERLE